MKRWFRSYYAGRLTALSAHVIALTFYVRFGHLACLVVEPHRTVKLPYWNGFTDFRLPTCPLLLYERQHRNGDTHVAWICVRKSFRMVGNYCVVHNRSTHTYEWPYICCFICSYGRAERQSQVHSPPKSSVFIYYHELRCLESSRPKNELHKTSYRVVNIRYTIYC